MVESHPVVTRPLVTRRDVVTAGAAALTVTTAASPGRSAFALDDNRADHQADRQSGTQATVTGVVFEDRSGTGARQGDDPGIAGVLVSNGYDVVRTDADGRYALPVDDEAVIFVIKPTGYAVPVDHVMLPRFYYMHRPHGTPAGLSLRYRGIAPTGPLPGSVDFALRRADEPTRFEVLLFTDPHAENPAAIDFIRTDVVNGLLGTDAAFGITTGDIMSDDLTLYERYNRIIAQLGIPWHNIAGNHDLNYEAPDRTYARETFRRTYGPDYYAFEYGGALFLMLDNVDYLGRGKYRGRFGARQLAFVAAVLRETPADRLVVAAMHIPLRTYLGANDPTVNTSDGAALLALLAGRPSVSFAGHTHTTEHHYVGGADGGEPHHHHVMTALCGSWWSGPYDHRGVAVADSPDGNPNGFHILSVDRNRATTRFRAAKEPAARQLRIVLDSEPQRDRRVSEHDAGAAGMGALFGAPLPQERVCLTDVVVNVFDGGPSTTVAYQIGGREPVRMSRETRRDPFVCEVFARNQATRKPWAETEPCSHLFVARLHADLEAGTHCIKVRAIDEYGREHRDHLCVEVVGTQAARVAVPG
jgi:hypothetical protein